MTSGELRGDDFVYMHRRHYTEGKGIILPCNPLQIPSIGSTQIGSTQANKKTHSTTVSNQQSAVDLRISCGLHMSENKGKIEIQVTVNFSEKGGAGGAAGAAETQRDCFC